MEHGMFRPKKILVPASQLELLLSTILFTLNITAALVAHAKCLRIISRTLYTHIIGPHKLAVRLLLYRGCHKV